MKVNTYHDLAGATTGNCVKVFLVIMQFFCLTGPAISASIYVLLPYLRTKTSLLIS